MIKSTVEKANIQLSNLELVPQEERGLTKGKDEITKSDVS